MNVTKIYEPVASYGHGSVKIVKNRNTQNGFTSFAVGKTYIHKRKLHKTGFLRSVNDLEELAIALEEAIVAEGGVVADGVEEDIDTVPF